MTLPGQNLQPNEIRGQNEMPDQIEVIIAAELLAEINTLIRDTEIKMKSASEQYEKASNKRSDTGALMDAASAALEASSKLDAYRHVWEIVAGRPYQSPE